MHITLDIADDALLAAQHLARRERVPLGDAVTEPIRRGATDDASGESATPLRGRFALLPAREEVVTPRHVRDLMEPGGI